MKAAVLANSSAGKQTAQRKILEALAETWKTASLCGVAGYGGELLESCIPGPEAGSYLERFSFAMERLLEGSPDLLITIGGDGTAAYAADWLLSRNIRLPIFGIGAGTANVGPIVTVRSADSLPAYEALVPVQMGAVEALRPDGTHIAYGFNDLVLGNTLLGSENGQTVTFDAHAMAARGERRICQCFPSIAGPAFSVTKNGHRLANVFPNVGQIVAATVERESFYGRAVAGALCFTPDSPFQAAVYLSAVPIITCQETPEAFDEWLPGGQLLLQPGDSLLISGLAPEVCAVADGNPYVLPQGSVILRYIPNLLTVMIRR